MATPDRAALTPRRALPCPGADMKFTNTQRRLLDEMRAGKIVVAIRNDASVRWWLHDPMASQHIRRVQPRTLKALHVAGTIVYHDVKAMPFYAIAK